VILQRASSVLRLLAGLCLLGSAACSRQPPSPASPVAAPLPQVSGTFGLDGVSAPVRIVRDRWGIPHIYAMNERDLFFAQGFVQAQDRLFQMDLWRRSVQGRLSEVLGLNFVERDAATRRVQYRGEIGAEWASYGPGVKPIAEAFVRGVNAWVAVARDHVPEEFALAGWLPDFWSPEDLLNRTDAFVAGDAELDVFRARLVAAVGGRDADMFFPAAALYRVPAGLDINAVSAVVGDALRRVGTAPFFLGLAAPVNASAGVAATGSNAWAVTGGRSATGAPLLANDPHRAFAHPSLRYLVHLNAPGWNVIGAASPWLPGVIIGHNDRVAWGMTAFAADTTDVYVEHVNPSNPHQVEYRGRWVATKIVRDPIVMKGQAKPFPFERELTPNGAIIASDSDRHLVFTLRWSGSEPGAAGELAALALDRARSSAELRASLARWKLPAVEVIYADVDGVAGRQVAGLVPMRSGWDGALPAPGWTGTFEWRGWRSLDSLPHALLPTAGGVAVSANQNAARTGRLDELLAAARAYTADDFKRFQYDITAWNAEQLVPLLTSLHAERNEVEAWRQQLVQWDRRVAAGSAAATIYVFWEEALARKLAESRLAPALVDEYVARVAVPVAAVTKPSRVWFDGDPTIARDRLLLDSLAAAVDRARSASSPNGGAPASPLSWGRLHLLTFTHPLAITQAARGRFNVGPFEQAGYAGTVLSTFPGLDVSGGATFREIVDLATWDRSVATNAPGQSGAPGSSHFADLAKPWAAAEYFPLAFTDAAVQTNSESVLTLRPR
jgi:penicillin G amidase